jgi:carbon storage regulator CsrA
VLSRKTGEKLVIGDGITVVVNRIAGNRVTLGIDAPDDVRIVRGELEPVVNAFGFDQDSRPQVPVASSFGEERDVTSASVPRLAK